MKKVFVVGSKDTARVVGSGELDVLATPVLIAYMEEVAANVCQEKTQTEETTVGIQMDMQHLAPTAVGGQVEVEVSFVSQDRAILTLEIEAREADHIIGKATHKRAIVNREKFMGKL